MNDKTLAKRGTGDLSLSEVKESDILNGFWIFGYGSLMWQPGFRHANSAVAHLSDHRRKFCLRSISFRGTPENPGLMLALDREPNAHCTGVAYFVAPQDAQTVFAYIHEREMSNQGYHERFLPVMLAADNRPVSALCYIVNKNSPHYADLECLESEAQIISRAKGSAGRASEYLFNTLERLRQVGVVDEELERLEARVIQLMRQNPPHTVLPPEDSAPS